MGVLRFPEAPAPRVGGWGGEGIEPQVNESLLSFEGDQALFAISAFGNDDQRFCM